MSAVLLAGGRSARMGRDKAGVELDGQPLWQRQLATLEALHPRELFISGRADGPYANSGTEVILDVHPDYGPLGGFEAAFQRLQTPLLCVLAIDLPWMTATFLARLVAMAEATGCGVVPLNGDYFEPLAAVYPHTMRSLIEQHLQQTDRSMQWLIRSAVERGLVGPYAIGDEERPLFRNVNTPADLGEGGEGDRLPFAGKPAS